MRDPERWKPPNRSVADSMSNRLDEGITAAEIDCEAPLVIVRKIIREDNYAILNCRLEDFDDCLDKFEEFLTKRRDTVPHTGESSEDGSIHDILGLHFYQCSFCPTVVDTGADLKAHIESDHLDDIFTFSCCHCNFDAEGPRDLDKHRKIAHGSYGASNTAASVVSNLRADIDATAEHNNTDKEIVVLDVEDMSSSDGLDWWHRCPVCAVVFTNKEEGTAHMSQDCDQPESDDLGDSFLCDTCNTVFVTEE
jgi:hypothetical protein